VVMEGRNREVRRLWESQGVVVSRLKRVRFGPVFMTSELTMGRWREMGQHEIDILSAEVGLTPQALPPMTDKARDKLVRQQRKSAKPVGRAGRQERTLRPASGGRGERAANGDATRGSQVAERPSDSAKRPARPAVRSESGERATRKPGAAPDKRRGPAAGEGQRPGFGRGPRKPQ
jgi:23S rRNA pseudouridine2605 synthase